MSYHLTLLGTGAAVPSPERFTSAQVLEAPGISYLIDCGEGTQIRLRSLQIRTAAIRQVFISHLHGDHFFGLPGLLTSWAMGGREKPLDIFSPPGLEEIIQTIFRYVSTHELPYAIHFHPFDASRPATIFEDQHFSVSTIPLVHRVPAAGFLFEEKPRPKNIRGELIEAYGIPWKDIPAIKEGKDWVSPDGKTISNTVLTIPPEPLKKFAYCSDTAYSESIIPLVAGADLLYHEATFLESERARAIETGHSTVRDAASIARAAGVKKLVVGHYSSRYRDLSPYLTEGREIFSALELGYDGKRLSF